MKANHIIKGIVKSVPGINYIYHFNRNTGGTCSSKYCYSVWMRHLVLAYRNGLTSIPKVVVELGPGDSLGTGLAALISGAEKYYALDIQKYGNTSENLKIFDELITLFKRKTEIPHGKDTAKIKPVLKDYSFPSHIFNDKYLNEVLDETRLSSIRQAIIDIDSPNNKHPMIVYVAPWDKVEIIKDSTVDMVFSQAALQSIDNLSQVYEKISHWLKPKGIQSHEIDFKSFGSADSWYGHWEYSDLEWKIVRGRKNFFINREPYSTHRNFIAKNDSILLEKKVNIQSNINRRKLAPRFRNLSEEDLSTCSAFVLARKNNS